MLETLALAKSESDRELEEAHVKRTALSEEMQVCSLCMLAPWHTHASTPHTATLHYACHSHTSTSCADMKLRFHDGFGDAAVARADEEHGPRPSRGVA